MSRSISTFLLVFFSFQLVSATTAHQISSRSNAPNNLIIPPNPNTNSLATQPQCFHPPSDPAEPITRTDCLELIYNFLIKPGASQFRIWDTEKQRFPIIIHHQTCLISIAPAAGLKGTDRFTTYEIAGAAARIMARCVTKVHGALGGGAGVGSQGVFSVVVAGFA
ncbi:MAG: hypothetical protein Q9170_004917 [Blastenia crenularia]